MKRGLAAVVVLGVLGLLTDVLAGPFVFLSTRASEPELRAGKMIGAIEGTIKRTDADTGTVRMPSGVLGLLSMPLLVTEHTTIVVAEKLGGFGDLAAGRAVRITYEVVRDRLVARHIDVRAPLGPDAPSSSEVRPHIAADEKPSVSAAAFPSAAVPLATPSSAAIVPIPTSPVPTAPLARAAPPAPPASLSGARQFGAVSSPPKRVVSPRPRVTKPRRPEGASKAPAVSAKPPAASTKPPTVRKEPPSS